LTLQRPLNYSKHLVENMLLPGEMAIDATAGNGHDTVFLAKIVGKNGRVWAFDVQEKALKKTKLRLKEEGLLHQVILLQESHEKMATYAPEGIGAIMFNLGYLPGGDHKIVTRPATTISAIDAGLALLRAGGIMTLVVYSGHQGGKEEGLLVKEFCSSLPQEKYQVLKYSFLNQRNYPPYLLAIYKH
jgi:predicted methyltransferase